MVGWLVSWIISNTDCWAQFRALFRFLMAMTRNGNALPSHSEVPESNPRQVPAILKGYSRFFCFSSLSSWISAQHRWTDQHGFLLYTSRLFSHQHLLSRWHVIVKSINEVTNLVRATSWKTEVRFPAGAEIFFSFPSHPDRLWGPLILLPNWYLVPSSGPSESWPLTSI